MDDKQIVFGVILGTLLVLLLVAGIFISLFMASKQRMLQDIKITQMELNFERELRTVEAEVSEKMMERFSQELHDNLGHILTCMRVAIENKKLDAPDVVATFRPIENYLDEALEQLRLLSRSLNTDYVSDIGLRAAMKVEVERLNQLRKNYVQWSGCDHPVPLSKDQELMVFRIFQEMIHNSIKHSKAKNLFISLKCEDGFELTVRDDGKGFNAEEVLLSHKASGLKNMLKRAKMAGMECAIESKPGQGCIYNLLLKK